MVPHLLLFLLLSSSSLSGTESAAALKLTNRCPQTIKPEILSGATTPPLPSLSPGKSKTIPFPTGWSGRIWGRTHCGTAAADCGAGNVELSLDGAKSPATVVDLTFDGAGGLDYSYAVGPVDEDNVPLLVVFPKKVGQETAAREKKSVACNDTNTNADAGYVIVFCPRPDSSKEVVGRRRGSAGLLLVNKTRMTTTWRRRHENAAFPSANTSSPADHQELRGHDGGDDETTAMVMMEPVETRMMLNDKRRRRLNSFQMCALCTCCGGSGSRHYCTLSPCCYAINCNIPNKPFGFCSFTPKACNCLGCNP